MNATWAAVTGYARQLNDTSWTRVMTYAWAAFITLAMLLPFVPEQWRGTAKSIGFALPLLLLAAKDFAQLPDLAARLRALHRQGAGALAMLAACLPPGLIGLARLDRELWRSFFCWLRRQPRPARPDGLRLTYLEQGAYSTAIAFGLFSVLVELPLDAALVPLFVDDPDAVRNIHIAVALGSAYTLVWLLGDRWRVRDGCHVLTATHLDLQVGARASARIALASIADAQPLREPVAQWRRRHPFRDKEAVTITPFDKPNLILRLHPDADCTITHHGLERNGVRYVFLYLDRPERLIAALASRA
ncbi:hypothetical protein [Massilia sp.]|uniref:hypothetical protein n=1 Tax=Massilia sp. TaxID=1882437 RepID=UPI002896965E|nr:hypothetical protein [Massilia sp.]